MRDAAEARRLLRAGSFPDPTTPRPETTMPTPTPGPWHANGGAVYATAECRANDAHGHGRRGTVEPLAVTRRDPADAVLMAAAPELRMACELAAEFLAGRFAYGGPDGDGGAGHVARTLLHALSKSCPQN